MDVSYDENSSCDKGTKFIPFKTVIVTNLFYPHQFLSLTDENRE